MRLHNAFVHDIFGNLVRARFNHYDLLFCAGDGDIHIAFFALLSIRVYDILTVDITHGDADCRALPRNIRNRNSNRCADHCGNFGLAILLNRENKNGNGNIVAHILREQRPDLAVYNTAGEDSLFGWPAFTF